MKREHTGPTQFSDLSPEQQAEAIPAGATWKVPPDYDTLLLARVKQLKEIDEALERVERIPGHADVKHLEAIGKELARVRLDLAAMIAKAEQEYRDF